MHDAYIHTPVEKHFTYFIHPIIIELPREELVSKLISMSYWKLAVFPDPMKQKEESYFLPYVRNILYPTWKWSKEEQITYLNKKDKDRIQALKDFHSIKFIHSCNDRIFLEDIQAVIFEIELLFLSHDTAFIIFKTQITEEIDVGKLLHYNHIARYINKFQYRTEEIAQPKIMYEQKEQLAGFRGYIDKLYVDMGIQNQVKEIFDTFMFAYNYTAIDKEYIKNDEKRNCIMNHLISVKEMYVDEEEQVVFDKIESYQPYKLCIYGFSKNSGIIFALIDKSKKNSFNSERLPNYFNKVYMKILLLALFQRITLLNYTYQLSNIEDMLDNQKSINYLRRNVLKFTNTYKFSQISNFAEALTLWRKWTEVFEVNKIYQEVQSELAEFDEYVFRIRTNKNNVLLNVLTIIFLPFTMISGLLGMNIIELQNLSMFSMKALWVCIGSILFVAAIIAIIRWLNKKYDM